MIFAAAGTKVFMGGVRPLPGGDLNAASFNSEVWTEIGEIETIGTFGDTAESISFASVNDPRTRKLKGTRDAGTLELVCGLDGNDAGQLALVAAEKTSSNHAFRVVFKDAPPGGTPSERLFVAMVMSATDQPESVNNVVKFNASLAINSNIVRIPASAEGAAPANTALPTITGTAEVAQTLTGTDGTWTGDPTPGLSRQWFGDGESLAGETGPTLTLTAEHEGMVITFMVSATNYHGTAHAISAATSPVASES